MIALKHLNSLQIIKSFFESGINLQEKNNAGVSVLLYALREFP